MNTTQSLSPAEQFPVPPYEGELKEKTLELPGPMQAAVVAALLHDLVAGYDTGGESCGRSHRALLAETAFGFFPKNNARFWAAQRACQANPPEFAHLAGNCRPRNLTPAEQQEQREYLLAGCEGTRMERQLRYTAIMQMKRLLLQHGWPNHAECQP